MTEKEKQYAEYNQIKYNKEYETYLQGKKTEKVSAIVVKDDLVLMVKEAGDPKAFLPGGTVELGEGHKEALIREVMEEAGCEVNMHDLAFEFEMEKRIHRVEDDSYFMSKRAYYFYVCTLKKDKDQSFEGLQGEFLTETENIWVGFDSLPSYVTPERLESVKAIVKSLKEKGLM